MRAQYDAQLEDRLAVDLPKGMEAYCPRESRHWFGTGTYVGDDETDWD